MWSVSVSVPCTLEKNVCSPLLGGVLCECQLEDLKILKKKRGGTQMTDLGNRNRLMDLENEFTVGGEGTGGREG